MHGFQSNVKAFGLCAERTENCVSTLTSTLNLTEEPVLPVAPKLEAGNWEEMAE